MSNAVKDAIDELRLAYETAVATGRIEAILPLLADGAVMVHPGAPDWQAMTEAASGAPFPAGARISINPIEVVALSEEWAYEFGTASTTYTPRGSGTPVHLRDAYLLPLRKTADGWKAYREVASSNPPPGGWPHH